MLDQTPGAAWEAGPVVASCAMAAPWVGLGWDPGGVGRQRC